MVRATCPDCGHRIGCVQCDHGICEACGADLYALYDSPPEPAKIEYTTLELGNMMKYRQKARRYT